MFKAPVLMFAIQNNRKKTEENTSRLTHVFSLLLNPFILSFLVAKKTICPEAGLLIFVSYLS